MTLDLARTALAIDRALHALTDPELEDVAAEVMDFYRDLEPGRPRQVWLAFMGALAGERRRRLIEVAELEFAYDGPAGEYVGTITPSEQPVGYDAP